LGVLYERAHGLYDAIVVRQARSGDEVVVEALSMLEACKKRVSEEALFSINEELDEIATGCIKYLFLDYFLAKVHGQYIRLDGRRSHLLVARELFGDYLQCCKRLGVLHEDEAAAVKAILDEDDDDDDEERQGSRGRKPLSSADQRAQKIAKFRRDKEARERIEALQSLLSHRRGEGEDESDGDREDRVRELSLLQMQHYARDCLDELPLLAQELTMLAHMEKLRAQSEGNGQLQQHQQQQGQGDNALLLPGRPPSPPRADRPGLLVTRTSLGPNGELVMTRETVKANVFTPSMAAPTVSLEEFAEQEVQAALQRETSAAQLRAQHQAQAGGDPTRRYAQVLLDGDEDDEQAVERAALNDRAWDDWKEDNQKGSGNKANKRF